VARAQTWPAFAGSPSRVSVAPAAPGSIDDPRWILSVTDTGAPISFAGQAGVVANSTRVYGVGSIGGQSHLIAAAAKTGHFLWATPIPAPLLESWSTPALDEGNGTVLIGCGQSLLALDAESGSVRWQTPFPRFIVNASALVTTDRGPADRALITTYSGNGAGIPARLYCINVDPFDTLANPYQPGDIVWSVPLGAASGNSPAYRDGIVYCSCAADSPGSFTGRIFARGIDDDSSLPDRWSFTNTELHGFYSGVCIADTPTGAAVFAASYAFYGGQLAANLVKLSAADGALVWSTACNRTDATPIPLPDGRIILSGGISGGFGSIPSIELFDADGTLRWDSFLDTWSDTNQNEHPDPGEYLLVGGWTQQPIAARSSGTWRIWAGAIGAGSTTSAPYTDLYILDLNSGPEGVTGVSGHFPGAGASPAAADGWLYTVGAKGLYGFAADCLANCDHSTSPPILNANDFQCFLNRFAIGDPSANCDGSTSPPTLNANDFQCFINEYAAGCP
jgi:outer membrane protein assembly factor BamB